jgi:hypothetical protein
MERLGCDPTVFVRSDEEAGRLTRKNEYPTAIRSSIGHDQRLCTIGPRIGTSLSLLGRGTHVWLVRESAPGDSKNFSSLNGDEIIMKTARRNNCRTPEPMIYPSIKPPILGLAKFECVGDVMFPAVDIILPGVPGHPITVRNLRSGLHDRDFLSNCDYEESNLPGMPILHRLILNTTVGRPMWTYTTDLDLLNGFRDALKG